MSRRSTNNSVSLFPFLAVLVCAMGALILLLLVTTRRIRAGAAREAMGAGAIAPATQPPRQFEPESEPVAAMPVESPGRFRNVPVPVADPVTDERWYDRAVTAIAAAQEAATMALNQSRRVAASASEDAKRLVARRASLTQQLSVLEQQQETANVDRLAGEHTQSQLQGQLTSARKELAERASQPRRVVSRFRMVPFDGASGTIRRPILIECTKDGFRFLPEDVALTTENLEGFPSGLNPLLAGAMALDTYWRVKDREQNPRSRPPYVLLVVRPGGSMQYYAARRMLKKMDTPVGYELIGDDQELDLPVADPEATRLCRVAVRNTLSRQDRMRELSSLANVLRQRRGFDAPPNGGVADSQGVGATGDYREELVRRLLAGRHARNDENSDGLSIHPRNHRNQTTRRRSPYERGTRQESGSDKSNQKEQQHRAGRAQLGQQPEPGFAELEDAASGTQAANDRRNTVRPLQQPVGRGSQGVSGGTGAANSGAMPFQRTLNIYVDPTSVTVGRNHTTAVGRNDSSDGWVARVLIDIQREMSAWGPAARGFRWVPVLRYNVSPGAGLLHARLKRRFLRMGLVGEDRFTLAPYARASAKNGGR